MSNGQNSDAVDDIGNLRPVIIIIVEEKFMLLSCHLVSELLQLNTPTSDDNQNNYSMNL